MPYHTEPEETENYRNQRLATDPKPFDLSKCPRNESGHWLCATKSGYAARVVCCDKKTDSDVTLVALIDHNGTEVPFLYRSNGTLAGVADIKNPESDLLNLPIKHKREGWLNVYAAKLCDTIYMTQSAADEMATPLRLACVKVTYEWEEK